MTLGVWPVPIMPIVTVEAYIQINVDFAECCKQDGNIGRYAEIDLTLELSGGVGTSIGGTSGVRAYRENAKNNTKTIRYRNVKGTEGAGQYAKRPRFKDNDFTGDKGKGFFKGMSTSFERRPCPTTSIIPEIEFTVGIFGFISTSSGRLSVGAKFDTQFGSCKIPGECEFKNPIKNHDFNIITGQGTGARLAIYGKANVAFNLNIL